MSTANEKITHELESQQFDILANVSHSVRTPIHTIMGMTDLALEDVEDAEAVEKYLRKIKKAGETLTGQINELLELTRLEKNEAELQLELCTYDTISSMIQEQLDLYAEDRRLHTKVEVAAMTRTTFMEDAAKLEQILANLISNAVKFTPDGGQVTVTAETLTIAEGRIVNRYTVADSGIGISEEFQQQMFYPFTRELNPVNLNEEGAGLGLYKVKRLVEFMKGSVNVASGQGGTRVTVELTGTVNDKDRKAPAGKPTRDRELLRGRRILLCEDNELNAEMTCVMLENAGMIAECAANGAEAVDKIRNTPPFYYDAVLMDIRMPIMNGLEATDKIRRMDREDTYMLPIVALTASAYQLDRKDALAAGMDAFLAKPFEVNALLEQLADIWCVYKGEKQ